MSTPTESTPEPVKNAAAVQAWFLRLLGGAAVVTGYYGWWTPSGDDLLVLAGFGSVVFASVVDVIGWITRKKVTPNAKVALTTTDLALIKATEAEAVNLTPPLPNPRFNDGPHGMLPPDLGAAPDA